MAEAAPRCSRCESRSTPATGVYLARLYPLERFCVGCGRRELFCDCLVNVTQRRAA